MPDTHLLAAFVGLQTVHGTAVPPTLQWPGHADYQDARELREAPYDAGAWTPTTIVNETVQATSLTTTGDAFFETLPICLSSGLDDITPTATYQHLYAVAPAGPATPKPCTWLVGAIGTNLGATGPCAKLKDLYLSSLALYGDPATKVVSHKATWFGTTYDDNSGAGYAAPSVTPPAALNPLLFLRATLTIRTAGTTGDVFTPMTAFQCALLNWRWRLTTGLRPKYCGDANATTMSGVLYAQPSASFTAYLRLSSASYALVRTAYAARTYQELLLTLDGDSTYACVIKMTGRWSKQPTPHARNGDEVTLLATFTCGPSYLQTTNPHYLAVTVNSANNWSGA